MDVQTTSLSSFPENCQLLLLRDGRNLAYSEYGDPNGKPVLLIHGTPGGRIQGEILHSAAKQEKIRIIAPDRPGYGYSDFDANKTIFSFADDVGELFNDLSLSEVAVVGISGGGSFALTIAYLHRFAVSRLVLLAGMAVVGDDWLQGFPASARVFSLLTKYIPKVAEVLLLRNSRKGFSAADLEKLLSKLPSLDQRVLSDPEVQKVLFGEAAKDMLRQGCSVPITEWQLMSRLLPFDPASINVPVNLVYGELDEAVPAHIGIALSNKMPNSTLEIVPEAGHIAVCGTPEYLFKYL